MWWITTTPPYGPSRSGWAKYASSSSPPWPVIRIVSAFIASVMARDAIRDPPLVRKTVRKRSPRDESVVMPERDRSSRWRSIAARAGVVMLAVAAAGGTAYLASTRHTAATGAAANATGHHPGASSGRSGSSPHHRRRQLSSTTTTTAPPPSTTTTTGPGTLPQTDALPPATSPQFGTEMAALWRGVVGDDVTAAMTSFFPKSAYEKLKSLADAAADYEDRLVADFRADIGAANALLGSSASSATLVGVHVPEQYAHWVTPGVCTNSIGYFEVPNARVIYQVGGAVRSFGIASMISWRGQWYVVHLGTVVRPTGTTRGVVDDPATGPGVSAYSSTC